MKRAFIGLTEEQRNLLRPVFLELSRNGGAIMAQVFTDGIHVVLLPDDIATRVAGTVGVDYLPKINSGFKAFSDGIERDKARAQARANRVCSQPLADQIEQAPEIKGQGDNRTESLESGKSFVGHGVKSGVENDPDTDVTTLKAPVRGFRRHGSQGAS